MGSLKVAFIFQIIETKILKIVHNDHYVILIFPLGKQESNYAGIFSKQQTNWQILKIKVCDFGEHFILKNVLDDSCCKFLDLRQTFLSLGNCMNTNQSICGEEKETANSTSLMSGCQLVW